MLKKICKIKLNSLALYGINLKNLILRDHINQGPLILKQQNPWKRKLWKIWFTFQVINPGGEDY